MLADATPSTGLRRVGSLGGGLDVGFMGSWDSDDGTEAAPLESEGRSGEWGMVGGDVRSTDTLGCGRGRKRWRIYCRSILERTRT